MTTSQREGSKVSSVTREQISGELLRDGKVISRVKLNITVKKMYVNERTTPVARAISDMALSSRDVEDGSYNLRYMFDGQQQEKPIRIENGFLLGR
jgi:hypothetical protein